jgi:hypothetical protein
MAEEYKPGEEVEHSGIYIVLHYLDHAPAHEVTCVYGSKFPECADCGDKAKFVLIYTAQDVASNAHFSTFRSHTCTAERAEARTGGSTHTAALTPQTKQQMRNARKQLFAARRSARQPHDVTMVQLIANPDSFDGEFIRVIGFLRLQFEGNVLYLHREDYERSILGNGIWVDVTSEGWKQDHMLDSKYVVIEGFFSSTSRGHMGAWSGSITNIRRAEVWFPAQLSEPH